MVANEPELVPSSERGRERKGEKEGGEAGKKGNPNYPRELNQAGNLRNLVRGNLRSFDYIALWQGRAKSTPAQFSPRIRE